MGTKLRSLQPPEAFEDAARRSLAAGAAGFLLLGMLNTSDAIPAFYRSLVMVSGMQAAFLGSLALLVAYYHQRWKLGFFGAGLSLFVPYVANLAWMKLSGRSLVYPVALIVFLGVVALQMIHRKVSGRQPDDDIEEEQIRILIEEMDRNLTWVDRVTWLCFTAAFVLLLVLLLR